MTPAMTRCLSAYRDLCNGRAPTIPELRTALGGIASSSVQRLIDRLRLAGFDLPLSRDLGGYCKHDRPPKPAPVNEQQAESIELRQLLRLADKLVSRYGDADDAEWRDFRRRAGVYLAAPRPSSPDPE